MYHIGPLLTDDECDRAVEESHRLRLVSGEVYVSKERPQQPSVRRSTVGFFDATHWVGKRLERFAMEANESRWGCRLSGLQTVQFASYSRGDRFNWHNDYLDAGSEPGAPPAFHGQFRLVTVVVALSSPTDYTGGDFLIAPIAMQHQVRCGGTTALRLARGYGVAFLASALHKVAEVQSGKRMTLTAWILGDPLSNWSAAQR